jgi:hypothetical protein
MGDSPQGSGSFHEINLIEHLLTEKSVNRTPFHRKIFRQEVICPKIYLNECFFKKKGHLTEKSFSRKLNLVQKTIRQMTIYQKRFQSNDLSVKWSFG